MSDPLHTEHAVPDAPAGPATTATSPPSHPIDAPFTVELAARSKWSQPRGVVPTSVVIHCTAATNPASSTAAFFASSSPSGSTQAVADDDEGFTCVPDDAICAGAPPLNQEGLHIEQPGLVTWSRAIWLAHDNQLRRVAYHVAGWCLAYSIPVVLLDAKALQTSGEGARGITYHAAVSEAFHQSTHTDPGPNYPWDVFMGYVSDYVSGGDDLSVLTDDEQFYLRGSMRYLNSYGPPPAGANPKVLEGYNETKAKVESGGMTIHDHPIPAGRTGTSSA